MNSFFKPFKGFISAVAGALLVVGLFHLTLWGKGILPTIAISSAPVDRTAKLGTSFAPIVKKAAPSVVNISSTRIIQEQARQNPYYNDRRSHHRMPPEAQPRSRKAESLGSGVIISPDGYILTANHVVEGADEIEVSVAGNKKPFVAKVIGTDPPTDVAVLKIDAKDLPAITLADSDQLEVGDIVLAIGNPFGIGQTVTMGIVSALDRSGLGFNGYENFIQTDAAINPGNSGGALVDAEGRLVGINTAIISRSGGNQGVGFAVPVNMARSVVERLIAGGKVTRGYLGIFPQDITPDLQQSFKLPDQNGALVGDVKPGTPAAQAGIEPGDVITAFNGREISDAHGLTLTVSQCLPNSSATVKLIRDGKEKTLKIKLAELPVLAGSFGEQGGSEADTSTNDALDGVTVDNLGPELRQRLRIPASLQGVIVSDVDPDSNSAEAGLSKGDVIVAIDRQPVTDADQAIQLSQAAKGDQILLKIWQRIDNQGGTRFLSVDNRKKEN